ncbi:MAG TPA: SPFH domain-containing protein [Symbiobacteriaceae bacterium]|jgi:regulator of protease activity HflC (stomatin/prohibitin superfamily)
MKKYLGPIVVVLLLIGAIGFAMFTDVIEPNSEGLRVSSGGKILDKGLAPGRYLIVPGVNHLVSITKASFPYLSDKSHVASSDGVQFDVNFAIPWVISDAEQYWKAFGTTNPGPGGQQVDNIAYSDVKEALRGLESQKIKVGFVKSTTGGEDESIFKETIVRTNQKLSQFGVAVKEIRLAEVDLQPSAKETALKSQVQAVGAMADQITAQARAQVAEISARTTKKVGEIAGEANQYDGKRRGEADAQALHILRDAVPDPALYQQLEATKALMNLPEGTKLVLGPENPLYQTLQRGH